MSGLSLSISLLSLIISAATLWLTYLRRGRLCMTQPTVVFFGFDTVPHVTAKVFLRTLLYSSAVRGQVVEGMYAVLRHEENVRTFSFWGYGETERLSPGSGVYVDRAGLAANHHFVMSVHEADYGFAPGHYQISVFARVVGRRRVARLSQIELRLSDALADALNRGEGVLFERDPASGEYRGYPRGRD